MIEPELITIIEGPTPDFRPTMHHWLHTIHEGPIERAAAVCELRTATGGSIMERCLEAWKDRRPVKLDFPDQMRQRQQLDVFSLRLREIEEGEILDIWVSAPIEPFFNQIDEDIDDDLEFGDDVDDDDLFI